MHIQNGPEGVGEAGHPEAGQETEKGDAISKPRDPDLQLGLSSSMAEESQSKEYVSASFSHGILGIALCSGSCQGPHLQMGEPRHGSAKGPAQHHAARTGSRTPFSLSSIAWTLKCTIAPWLASQTLELTLWAQTLILPGTSCMTRRLLKASLTSVSIGATVRLKGVILEGTYRVWSPVMNPQ